MSPKKATRKTARPRAGGAHADTPLRAIVLVDAARLVKVLRTIDHVALIDATRPASSPDPRVKPVLAEVRKRRRTAPAWMPPILYLHDAATVLYPFAIEPLATLLTMHDERVEGPFPYRDLGLAPLGTSPRRFSASASPDVLGEEPVFELASIPDAVLVPYVERSIQSAIASALIGHRADHRPSRAP